MKQWLLQNKTNLIFYLLGFFTIGFSVNIIKASNLGNGAWDTVTINIRDYLNTIVGWDNITLGMVSFVVSITIFSIVNLYRKQRKYLYMIIPIFLVAVFIDFWNIIVFKESIFDILWIQVLCYGIGLLLLPLGLVFVIKSSFAAFVFDEWMLMLVEIFKTKNITGVRYGIEFLGMSIGTIFGYLTYYHIDGSFGAVNIGSFVFTFAFTPIMAYYFKLLNVPHK